MGSKLVITHLSHDLQANKSYVSFVWSDDPSKRLGLEVPFGTSLETVEVEAKRPFAHCPRSSMTRFSKGRNPKR